MSTITTQTDNSNNSIQNSDNAIIYEWSTVHWIFQHNEQMCAALWGTLRIAIIHKKVYMLHFSEDFSYFSIKIKTMMSLATILTYFNI